MSVLLQDYPLIPELAFWYDERQKLLDCARVLYGFTEQEWIALEGRVRVFGSASRQDIEYYEAVKHTHHHWGLELTP